MSRDESRLEELPPNWSIGAFGGLSFTYEGDVRENVAQITITKKDKTGHERRYRISFGLDPHRRIVITEWDLGEGPIVLNLLQKIEAECERYLRIKWGKVPKSV